MTEAIEILQKLHDGTYLDMASEINDEGWEAIDAALKGAHNLSTHCDTCKNQGKHGFDQVCLVCSEFYGSKWEAK